MQEHCENSVRCKLRLLSALPGRERWESNEIKNQDIVCAYISATLKNEQGVSDVVVNARTGRILVLFESAVWPNGARQALYTSLQKVAAKVKHFAFEPEPSPNPPATTKQPLLSRVSDLPGFVSSINAGQTPLLPLAVYSGLNTLVKIAVPLSAGLAISSTALGGLPILAKIGLRSQIAQLAVLSASYFALTALEGAIEHRRVQKWTGYANAVEHRLRTQVMDHIRNMDTADQNDKAVSDFFSILDNDIPNIKNFLLKVPHSAIEKSLTFTIAGASLAVLSPVSLLLALIPLPFIHFATARGNDNIRQGYMDKAQERDRFNRLLSDNLQGLTTIKEFTAENRESERLHQASLHYQQVNSRADSNASGWTALLKLSVNFTVVIPIIYGAFRVITEKQNFRSFSIQTAFLPSLVMATQGIHDDIHLYQSAKTAQARLKDLLAIQPTITNGPLRLDVDRAVRGELILDNISFAYRGKDNAVDNLSMHIAPGKITALVGTTGSGKSTLARLLMRLYETEQGHITLDNHDLSEYALHDLRRNIAMVSQDTHLFAGTIADNIRYGSPSASHEELLAAASQAQALDFISALPAGFDTLVGDGGTTLSGGQRQRLSLARAILKNAPILILDEATSAVDNETEFEIQKAITQNALPHQTTIIIAHRLSTVRQADNIYVIENGGVKESGTHKELLQRDGQYAKLWGLQINDHSN